MKKLISTILKKKQPIDQTSASSRITSETVAEHREKILAGGRRFKYPIQYAKHKLVINAIIIGFSALLLVILFVWWQLYYVQNNSNFFYRITRFVPLPVAKIDNEFVKYSDYLMRYLKSVHYLEKKEQLNLKTDDGKSQIKFIMKESIDEAVADAYAAKLAKELGIFVNEVEFQSFLKTMRKLSTGEVSEQTQAAAIMDYFGWSQNEYSYIMKNSLLRQKVSYAIDDEAKKASEYLINEIKNNDSISFKDLSGNIAISDNVKAEYGVSGLVPKTNQDGGLTESASKLKIGQSSSIIKPTKGDGYYVVRTTEVNETQVNYEYIKIPLVKFSNSLKKMIDDDKLKLYISI